MIIEIEPTLMKIGIGTELKFLLFLALFHFLIRMIITVIISYIPYVSMVMTSMSTP
jgi:hypothetical protein